MFKVDWIDFKREPQCAPDPRFPNGKDVSCGGGSSLTCFCELPYPAPRCGMYIVRCDECGISLGVTTAGRPDDPRSVRVPCKRKLQ
jgi:hypothetical protein